MADLLRMHLPRAPIATTAYGPLEYYRLPVQIVKGRSSRARRMLGTKSTCTLLDSRPIGRSQAGERTAGSG
eukprot:1160855-Pelagomonas_calceolata.AAC.2